MMICPCLTWKSKPGSKIYFRDKAVFSNRLYFLCNIYTQEREAEATFAWDVYDRLRGRREVIGSVSTNCFLLKHDTKVWPFPKFTPVMVVSLASKLPGALVGREHVCLCPSPTESLLTGYVIVSFHLFPECNAKKCHFPCHLWSASSRLSSNKQWEKIYSCIRNLALTKQYLDAVRRNMSLRTIGISCKHPLVFFRWI